MDTCVNPQVKYKLDVGDDHLLSANEYICCGCTSRMKCLSKRIYTQIKPNAFCRSMCRNDLFRIFTSCCPRHMLLLRVVQLSADDAMKTNRCILWCFGRAQSDAFSDMHNSNNGFFGKRPVVPRHDC